MNRFIADHLALDFVNTKTTEGGGVTDALPTYREMLGWFKQADVLSAAEFRTLGAADGSRESSDTLHALRAFRNVVRALLDDARTRGEIAPRYLSAVNERLATGGARRALVREVDGYALRVQYRFERPRDLMLPVASAVAELIAQEDLTRIKRCGSDCCDMYFLDTSRNRSRTWCDMAVCGNRAKANAYYRRVRAAG